MRLIHEQLLRKVIRRVFDIILVYFLRMPIPDMASGWTINCYTIYFFIRLYHAHQD